MSDKWRIVPLGGHDRTTFGCGVQVLDRYLREQAAQDARRHVGNCFVALGANDEIAAYYTFSATSVRALDLPDDVRRKLPHYSDVPAALIGRLAVDLRFRRQRLGEALVADAARRALAPPPAVFALVVDAKDGTAESFYLRLGFRPVARNPQRFFLPIKTAVKALIERSP